MAHGFLTKREDTHSFSRNVMNDTALLLEHERQLAACMDGDVA